MQKILFSLLAGGIILAGCSKDTENNASIVGTWNVNMITSQVFLNNVLQGSDTTTEGSVEFDSDGSFTSTDSGGPTTGTYIYNTSSKELTVISGGDTSHATVTNLTSNNLHFKQDETQTIGGATVRVTTDADYSR